MVSPRTCVIALPSTNTQAEAKKQFADDLCFHVIYFPFLVLAFAELSSLRTYFWPFTEVVRKIPARGYAETWRAFADYVDIADEADDTR